MVCTMRAEKKSKKSKNENLQYKGTWNLELGSKETPPLGGIAKLGTWNLEIYKLLR